MDIATDKLSIKNLLFSRAIPVHELPANVSVEGRKIYSCTDCGDKFLFETSYEDHVNRRSMLITYMCRHCGATKIFYNRCRLLQHIRSHSFKTATINVNDLRVEPVPVGMYKLPAGHQLKRTILSPEDTQKQLQANCLECKKQLPYVGGAMKDRVAHLMECSNQTFSCPVCLFALPTMCAFRAHLRFHLKFPPYYCPECGLHILNRNIFYPYNHDCEGFNMMRATVRVKCPVEQCHLLHPNESKDHMKDKHVKKVYKCPVCVVACFNETTMINHLRNHDTNALNVKALIFYQCELCPGRLVLQNHIETHLRTHLFTSAYPCWTCGQVFKEVFALVEHHLHKHADMPESVQKMYRSMINESENQQDKPKRIYRVIKRCDQCNRNFTYKCKYNEIHVLPNECPYKCTSRAKSKTSSDSVKRTSHITCHICREKVPYNWPDIKKHYAKAHKDHRCVEPKLVIDRINVDKSMTRNKKKIFKQTKKKRKRQVRQPSTNEQNALEIQVPIPNNQCRLCGQVCDVNTLETHLKTHRDPCMAYQCLECGKSFVVKPSFSKHLMLAHSINDVEEYIKLKECYNENALEKQQTSDLPMTPPKENQCTICMDQFDNAEDLEKHFRVHGMAFLLKNTSNNKDKTDT